MDACRFKKVAQDGGEDLVFVQARQEEEMEPTVACVTVMVSREWLDSSKTIVVLMQLTSREIIEMAGQASKFGGGWACSDSKVGVATSCICCLEHYIAKVNRETRSLDEARGKYLQDRPGAKTLSTLSRLGCSERILSPNRIRLFRNIAHCLIADNDKEAIWRWARDGSPSGAQATSSIATSSKHERWKQVLIRSTVEAQIHWTSKHDFTADPLATIAQREGTFELWDKRSAIQRLVQVLSSSSDSCEDLGLFNRFQRAVHALFKHGDIRKRYVAVIDLVHLTHPSANSYLQFLRNNTASDEVAAFIDQFFDPTSLRAAQAMCSVVYRIVRVCLIEGNRKDAIWVLDLVYGHRPQLFGTAAVIESYLHGLEKVYSKREIPTNKRKATASEIEAGLDVDESGYLRLSPRLEDTIRVTPRLQEHYR